MRRPNTTDFYKTAFFTTVTLLAFITFLGVCLLPNFHTSSLDKPLTVEHLVERLDSLQITTIKYNGGTIINGRAFDVTFDKGNHTIVITELYSK